MNYRQKIDSVENHFKYGVEYIKKESVLEIFEDIKKIHDEELDDVAKQSEFEFWKQLKNHFEPKNER